MGGWGICGFSCSRAGSPHDPSTVLYRHHSLVAWILFPAFVLDCFYFQSNGIAAREPADTGISHHLELVPLGALGEHNLGGLLSGNAPKDGAVQEGVASESIRSMDPDIWRQQGRELANEVRT